MPYQRPQTLEPLAADPSPASRVRYRVVGMLVLMAVLLYLDRYCITPVQSVMIDELAVDKEEFGRAVGGFFLAYALLQVPAGWLADCFGARKMLAAYVALWSVATMALGFAHGLAAVLCVRIALGVTQAGAYPAAAAAIRSWVPLSERARANSCVSMGGRLGGLLTIALTPLLMQAVASALGWTTGLWRPVFMLYGGIGLVWAIVFWWRHRDLPQDHPACNPAEIELAMRDHIADADSPRAAQRPPIVAVIADPNIWVLSAINFLLNVGWIFLVTWMPTYLIEVYRSDLDRLLGGGSESADLRTTVAGGLTAATALAGIFGNLCGGWWGDRAVARFGLRWGRRATGLAASLVAASVYFAALFTDNLWLFVGEMIAISFLSDLVLGSVWAIYQDVGRANTAVVLGFANMCGNLGAAGYGWLIGLLAQRQQWSLFFAISSVGFCIAAVCWLLADATRTLKIKPVVQ
jgi:MFS transporter, ACS family, glucarate transporter